MRSVQSDSRKFDDEEVKEKKSEDDDDERPDDLIWQMCHVEVGVGKEM